MCMYVHSLAPEADDLGGIRVISTAGGIPYVNSKQVKLFVVKVKVERPKKKSRKKKKSKGAKGKGRQ